MQKRAATTRRQALFSAVLMIVASTTIMTGTSFGQVEPKIAFLNPSDFATAGERGLIVSDAAPTAGPGCCEGVGSGYRLSAWVSDAPPGSSVFFAVVQRAVDIEITQTSSPSPNMWEANWSIPPEILDGAATLYAYLVMNEEPIAVAEADVTIMRVQERAHLRYPNPGGAFGTYAALADSLPADENVTRSNPTGVVDALYNDETDISYVRSFYTTSGPGSEPDWKVCGTELVGATRAGNGVRCAVDPNDQLAITAVAAVSNDSPDEYDARFNQAGDAVAIADPYAQEVTSFSLATTGTQHVERERISQTYFCSDSETATVTDQVGRQIAGANVDVHAAGPSDTLKFNTFGILTINQAPDRGAHVEEAAYDCEGQRTAAPTAPPGNANPDVQGEHPRFGAPDRKHVESLGGGTSDLGTFGFRAHATVEGMTEWTMWVDETDDGCAANDDAFTPGELFVSGAIGWGQDAFATAPQPYEVLVPCTPAVPTPEPSPTGGEEEVDGSRTVSAAIVTSPIVIGKPARFKGRIEGAESVCENLQKVVLKVRKPGQRFVTRRSTTSDGNGRFELRHVAKAPRDYQVVAPPNATCDRAKSPIIRLRK